MYLCTFEEEIEKLVEEGKLDKEIAEKIIMMAESLIETCTEDTIYEYCEDRYWELVEGENEDIEEIEEDP